MNSFYIQKIFSLISISFTVFVFPLAVSALTEDDIALKLSPSNPKPLEDVTASLTSYAVDLNRLPILWRINGTTVSSGTGKKSVLFQAPASGKSVLVTATVTIGESFVTKSTTISTGNIELLWETIDVWVPKFYQGKKLPSPESTIRVVALPRLKQDGVTLKPNTLVYEWRRNEKLIPGASGYGKFSATFTNSNLKKNEVIEVTATSFDGSVSAKTGTTISIIDPFVLFYEQSSLVGEKIQRAVRGTFPLRGKEVTLSAEPYFFSTRGGSLNYLYYEWRMNKKIIDPSGESPNLITLRPEENSGTANVSLKIRHPEKILQEAQNSFTITF